MSFAPINLWSVFSPDATGDNIIVSLEGNSAGYLGHPSPLQN